VIWWLTYVASVAVAFLLGFMCAGWIRQVDIDSLRNDLALAHDREMKLRDSNAELQSSLWKSKGSGSPASGY
jgi:hypothetical protein